MHQTSSRCACTALRKASRALSRVYDDALAGSGMSTVQFSILRTAARNGTLPLSRLAELLVMERTTLYRALGPLEKRGWLLIAGSQGRIKTVALTDAGRRAMADATAGWEAAQAKVLGAFGPQEWAGIEASLTRLVAIAAEHSR